MARTGVYFLNPRLNSCFMIHMMGKSLCPSLIRAESGEIRNGEKLEL